MKTAPPGGKEVIVSVPHFRVSWTVRTSIFARVPLSLFPHLVDQHGSCQAVLCY